MVHLLVIFFLESPVARHNDLSDCSGETAGSLGGGHSPFSAPGWGLEKGGAQKIPTAPPRLQGILPVSQVAVAL
jgi:hypothetical protein